METARTVSIQLLTAIFFCWVTASAVTSKYASTHITNKIALPEGMFLSIPELIKYWGYPAETHPVTTEDGYILTMHRIPFGRKTVKTNRRRPVMLFLPGLLLDSASFVGSLPHQSLGYVIADAGYDVWLGNNRGTTHSKKHVHLNVNNTQFWDFSFQEMAKYDFPAMVDYILNETNEKQLHYAGFSQGNTIAFAALSENMNLQKKIKTFFALAPVARISSLHPLPIRMMFEFLTQVMKMKDYHELMAHDEGSKFYAEILCPIFPDLCRKFTLMLVGGREESINATRQPLHSMHTPAGTSMKNWEHWTQVISTNKFKRFDYGKWGNLIRYGALSPPVYDLTKIKVPTVLISGSDDRATAPIDVEWIASQLLDVARIVVEGYGHAHFNFGIDAKTKYIDKMLKLAK